MEMREVEGGELDGVVDIENSEDSLPSILAEFMTKLQRMDKRRMQ